MAPRQPPNWRNADTVDNLQPVPASPPTQRLDPIPTQSPAPTPSVRGIAFTIAMTMMVISATVLWMLGQDRNMLEYVVASVAILALLPFVLLRAVRGPEKRASQRIVAELAQPFRPSKRSKTHATSNEVFYCEFRRHPICMLGWWTAALLFYAALITGGIYTGFWNVALVIGAVGTLFFAYKTFLWYHDRVTVTNNRIFQVHGIFSRNILMMPLQRMTDLKYTEPWTARLLSALRVIAVPYGTLVVETAGQDQALSDIRWVPCVREIFTTRLGPATTEKR